MRSVENVLPPVRPDILKFAGYISRFCKFLQHQLIRAEPSTWWNLADLPETDTDTDTQTHEHTDMDTERATDFGADIDIDIDIWTRTRTWAWT